MVKIVLIVLISAVAGFLLYTSFAFNQTPGQPYTVVKKIGSLEIRFYPSAVEATVVKSGAFDNRLNAGFRDLAGYIFGGNDRGEKIAMTTPVKTAPADDKNESSSITFVMPENFNYQNKPKPRAENIRFTQTQPEYTASLSFGGFAGKETMERHARQLLELVNKAGLRAVGPVRYLYYNPPFQLFNRKNEVLVPIDGEPKP